MSHLKRLPADADARKTVGNFLPWVEKEVWFSRQTAERVMVFTEKCDHAGILLTYHPGKMLTVSNLPPPLPPNKYRVLYADPPWKYRDK